MADIKCQNYIHKYKCLEYVLNHNACEECECRVRNPVIEELEKIKAELNDYHLLVDTGERNPEVTFEIGKQLAIKVIDEYIAELKGENNE